MIRTQATFSSLALLSTIALVVAARPQGDAKPSQSDVKKHFAAASEKDSAPTESHAKLALFVGEFDQSTEARVGPGDPMRVRSTAKGERIFGGRYVRIDSSSAADEELKGDRITMYGYDKRISKYTLWTIDTMTTFAVTATGDWDEATKTFTFDGERDQPGMGKVPFRWILRGDGTGGYTQEIRMKFPGAADFVPMVTVKNVARHK